MEKMFLFYHEQDSNPGLLIYFIKSTQNGPGFKSQSNVTKLSKKLKISLCVIGVSFSLYVSQFDTTSREL